MNQAALHQLLANSKLASGKDGAFKMRLLTNLPLIKHLFFGLYPEESFLPEFQKLIGLLSKLYEARPDFLRKQDHERVEMGNWHLSQEMVGMQLYVDHFNDNLKGLQNRLAYFEGLGINFLHLMPITTRPNGPNDGGYAVNSHTEVDGRYGTKEDLVKLTEELRSKKMYLMLDFVVNHTSDQHEWAKQAKAGNLKYQDYFYTFSNRNIPDAFERSLPEVFPETSPGNFTYIPEMEKWVMTVFNSYQWDLNYRNPLVFFDMLANLVELSNMGADIVRLDALAFLWKKLGTNSQNLPEAHQLISLFRLCLQVIAPGTILLAEAIVAPVEIVKYFGDGIQKGNECEIAYNASLMALLWNSIATKKTALLYKSLAHEPKKPASATWINYLRCHDDIGLGLDDKYIAELGWNPQGHRKFLLDYYCQRLDWSPAKGLLFMYNPKTGDGRITGSAASLLGLENALETKNQKEIKKAVDKIIMMHGIILAIGGIPMIYAGDEIATLNDYTFLKDDDKREDSRWVNRPAQNWALVDKIGQNETGPEALVYKKLQQLIAIRKKEEVFADLHPYKLHYVGNEHLLVFERTSDDTTGVLVIVNFDESPHKVEAFFLKKYGYETFETVHDWVSDERIGLKEGHLMLEPYQLVWLKK